MAQTASRDEWATDAQGSLPVEAQPADEEGDKGAGKSKGQGDTSEGEPSGARKQERAEWFAHEMVQLTAHIPRSLLSGVPRCPCPRSSRRRSMFQRELGNLLHEGGFSVERTAEGEFVFFAPNGERLPRTGRLDRRTIEALTEAAARGRVTLLALNDKLRSAMMPSPLGCSCGKRNPLQTATSGLEERRSACV